MTYLLNLSPLTTRYVLPSVLFILLLSGSGRLAAQDLSAHRWENRLILLSTDHQDNPLYLQQLELLRTDTAGLQERKLMIYRFKPGYYTRGLSPHSIWKASGQSASTRQAAASPFSVSLIGLDGGTKLLREAVTPTQFLFELIDGMPMRRQELKQGRKN